MKPPRACHGCHHWDAFPVDGKCCLDLDVIMQRQADGLRKREEARRNTPAPVAPRPPKLAATPILAPREAAGDVATPTAKTALDAVLAGEGSDPFLREAMQASVARATALGLTKSQPIGDAQRTADQVAAMARQDGCHNGATIPSYRCHADGTPVCSIIYSTPDSAFGKAFAAEVAAIERKLGIDDLEDFG